MNLPRRKAGYSLGLLLIIVLWQITARADEGALTLLIQPLPRDEHTTSDYQPLARYIEILTGRRCVLQIPSNFPVYWNTLKRNDYDIAFDGPHFTDYRVYKFGFNALAKIPDIASYSLITRDNERIFDPAQLVGRRIASLGLLSTGTARLNGMFPNPVRQPVLVEVQSAEDGIQRLLDKRVEAAFLPTAVVSEKLRHGGIAVVLTTEPAARLILSTSPRLAPNLTEKIREGLLSAHRSEAGRIMLQDTNLERFEPVTTESFINQRNVLKSYYGY